MPLEFLDFSVDMLKEVMRAVPVGSHPIIDGFEVRMPRQSV